MSAWSNLPNAVHIDRIIESAKSCAEIWSIAHAQCDEVNAEDTWKVAMDIIWDTPLLITWHAARTEIFEEVYGLEPRQANRLTKKTRPMSWSAVRDAVIALIVYDDCAHYLDLTSSQLQFVADLTERLAPRLLLAAVRAFEMEKIKGELL
jgi:hypothetical protein